MDRAMSEAVRRFMSTPESKIGRDNKLSGAIVTFPGLHQNAVENALAAIDAVHHDGDMPKILLQPSSARVKYSAMYQSIYQSGDNKRRAYRILLSRHAELPGFDFVHEIGHFISQQAWPGAELPTYSPPTEAFHKWLISVIRSTAIHDLTSIARHGLANIWHKNGGFSVIEASQRKIDYLLDPEEIWARSYAQYIAVKSQNPELMRELDVSRQAKYDVPYYPEQWTDPDFEPIMNTMDEIFHQRGWR